LPLAIAAASEAFASSGIDPARLSLDELRRFGIIIGSGGGSAGIYRTAIRIVLSRQAAPDERPLRSYHCDGGRSPADLSIRFGMRGPSHVVTTGCTSSTDALNYATRQIQSGRADCVLSGGR